MKTKTSFGVALCRYNKNKNNSVEIMVIKKRYSYAFLSFVMAHYKKNDTKYIKYLFNNMSFSEKIDILSMQFSQMWYRIWLNLPEKYFNITDVYKSTKFANSPIENRYTSAEIYKLFFEKKNKFESNFLNDKGKKLQTLIQNSDDAEILWEIPKGKKDDHNETNMDCAVREFYEETSITHDKYKILYNIEPLVDSYVDNDTIYKTIYYTATLKDENEDFTPQIDYRNFDQISEIEQIKWVSLSEIKFFNLPKSMHFRLIKLYKSIIHTFKQSKKIKRLTIFK